MYINFKLIVAVLACNYKKFVNIVRMDLCLSNNNVFIEVFSLCAFLSVPDDGLLHTKQLNIF